MIEEYKPHHFNVAVAKAYGIPAGIVYNYIEYRSLITPGRYFPLSLSHLCELYPYMGQKQVWSALRSLTHPTKRTPAIVHRQPCDGGYRYCPMANIKDPEKPHAFDVRIAEGLGIVPAVIYHNVSHWIKKNWQLKFDEVYPQLDREKHFGGSDFQTQLWAYKFTQQTARFRESVKVWAERHPWVPLRSAERGFSTLLETGFLELWGYDRRQPVWLMPEADMIDYLAVSVHKAFDGSDFEIATAKRKNSPPKGKTHRQKEKLTAKRKLKQDLTITEPDTSEVLIEALVDEAPLAGARLMKHFMRDITASQATPEMTVALASPRPPSEVIQKLRRMKLDQPSRSEFKKKVRRDSLGNVVTRQYIRKPKSMDDPDFDLYMEDLSEPERQEYLASLGK